MTPTEQYIRVLTQMKIGDIGLLRSRAGQGLDESVDGFDLFTGLWWPLRQKNDRAPRRDVAWLIAKLYAFCPTSNSPGDFLAHQLSRCQPRQEPARQRYRMRFDRMLLSPVGRIEPSLQWALEWLRSNGLKIDWVMLTDDLSIWEREATRIKWAEQFLHINERNESC